MYRLLNHSLNMIKRASTNEKHAPKLKPIANSRVKSGFHVINAHKCQLLVQRW
jgi:hypothetical protein